MADLVFGLAKSAVEGTLTMAKSAMEEEKKLQKSVQLDLMLITDEFEMMHAFLNVAKDRVADDVTRTLVRQVRNMALDVEDCIETVVHLDHKPNWWRRMLPSCMPSAVAAAALDDAVAGMHLLKTRVEAMGQRNIRYGLISDSGSKPTEHKHQQAVANITASNMVVGAWDAVEKKSGLDLIDLINKNDGALNLQVISVLGTLGTMSTIKKAYDDPAICKNFRYRAWVKLMHPFNPHEFIRSLLAQFYKNYCPEQESSTVDCLEPKEVMVATAGILMEEFMKQMSNVKYLVILEDVSTMVDWEAVRVYLPDKNNGSCIVVNTQQLEFASLCVGHPHRVLELEKFSADHSVCVLFKEDGKKGGKSEAARDWLNTFQLVGRQTDLTGVWRYNLSNTFQVSSLWGIAGVGKTSLAKHIYCKNIVFEKRYRKFGWVSVSHPFNLRDLSRSLLLDLHTESAQHGSILRIKDPIQECRELLQEDRCFVVIGGLQFTEEWDLIKASLALGETKSCIIIITTEERVATYCATSSDNVWNVKGLEAHHALDLFKNEAYKWSGSSDLSRMISLSKFMLPKCGGLPKVIVAVAQYVSNPRRTTDLLELRLSFMHKLETDEWFGSLRGLFAWVHSYFRTCPDFLKPCVFYLSIFPVNHSIRGRRLVRRWIAEGYSREDTAEKTAEAFFRKTAEEDIAEKTAEKTVEKTAEAFLWKLMELSMIQQQDVELDVGFRMPLCQVNGFFREYINSRPMEENLVFVLESHSSKNSQRTGRHLAIGSTWNRDTIVYESIIDFSRLRSLTVFGEWRSFFISDKMRLLRVLDLEDTLGVTDKDLEQMVKLLRRLKFLSLRGCREITRLPDSLGGLKQLQTLDIKHTSVVTLPPGIIKLRKLQYIRAGTSPLHGDNMVASLASAAADEDASTLSRSMPLISWLPKSSRRRLAATGTGPAIGVEVHRGIEKLPALLTLGVVNISTASGEATLDVLKNLTRLRKLAVCGINQNNSKKFFSAISGLDNLESLSLRFDKDVQGFEDYIDSPPLQLNCLKLYGLRNTLPKWIKELRRLTKLNLQMTTLPQKEINSVMEMDLSSLHICLTEFEDGMLRVPETDLRFLEIACNSRLHYVTLANLFFFEVLRIRCCHVSSLRFSGLKDLKNLKQVCLSGSYDDAVKQHLQSQLDKHEKKPVLKLEEPCPST